MDTIAQCCVTVEHMVGAITCVDVYVIVDGVELTAVSVSLIKSVQCTSYRVSLFAANSTYHK